MATIAERYNNASDPQQEDGLRLIDQLSPTENSRVLDVGCGTGYLASVLSERVGPGGKVVGVDPDKERIQLARASNHSNVTFMEGSFGDFPEGPYDLIFSNYVLHWVKDKESAFKNVFDNLTAGGRFAFTTNDAVPQLIADLAAFMGIDMSGFAFHCSPDYYEKIAAKCKFSLELKTSEIRKVPFPNIDSFLEWTSAGTVGGMLDHKSMDAMALADFKKPFGDQPVELEMRLIIMVFGLPEH